MAEIRRGRLAMLKKHLEICLINIQYGQLNYAEANAIFAEDPDNFDKRRQVRNWTSYILEWQNTEAKVRCQINLIERTRK
jgi:hypothetical protein